jgi:gliding motility-associated-like protein
VVIEPTVIPLLAQIDTLCEFSIATSLPQTDLNGITGTWSPDTILTDVAGTFEFVFTPDSSYRCFITDTVSVVIMPFVMPLLADIDTLCEFSIPPSLPQTDLNGITGTWSPDTIMTDVAGIYEFVFTPDLSYMCFVTDTISVVIEPTVIPLLAQIDTLCEFSIAPSLPQTDLNGITGTWSPDTILTDVAGTFEFVFTPDSSYRCFFTDTISVVIMPFVMPLLAEIDTLCEFSIAPSLPQTDLNGITGTWSPDTILTDVAGTFDFVFTPDLSYMCFVTDTISVVIEPTVIPLLAQIDTLCEFSIPPSLPQTDLNGITGTWSPDTILTDVAGTYEFVFTPDSSYRCFITDTISVVIEPTVIPLLTQIDTLCEFSIAPSLPQTDLNGITGTWSPDTILTDVAGIYEFVFTPDSSYGCFITDTISVVIMPFVMPLLAEIDTLCEFSIPPSLPQTDLNGITGTWSPDTILTDVAGVYEFVFTPDLSYMCFVTDTISVVIEPTVVPLLAEIDTLCEFSIAPSLPQTDLNGITGTWSPDTIITDVAGTYDFVFTPDSSYGCFLTDTISVVILPIIIADVAPLGPFNQYDIAPSLPTVDINNVSGTWLQGSIITDSIGFFEYVFIPDSTYQCFISDTILIEIRGISSTVTDTLICENSPEFIWNGQTVVTTIDSSYIQTNTNINGLDSTITLNVYIIPALPIVPTDTVLCEGTASFTWNGQTVFTDRDSIYYATLVSTSGCDSILILNLEILPSFRDTVSLTVCESSLPYPWESLILNTAGTYSDTLASTAGCDSILTIILQTVPEFRDTVSLTICESSLPYPWESLILNTAGTYSDTLASTAGCDSILTIILQTVPEFRDTVSLTVCETDLPYLWETLTLNAAGTYSDILASTAGCDSIRTIILQTVPELVVDVNITADKLVVDEGESVTFTASPVNGGTNPVYRWYVNNVQVTSVNLSTYTYVPNDKDEVYAVLVSDLTCATNNPANSNILTLTVNIVVPPPVIVADTIAICIQDVPVTWNGKEYKDDGLYSDTLATAAGADSIVQLRLILIPEIKPTFGQFGPYCQNVIPVALPTVSDEGIRGSWSQTTINTSVLGSQLITFTPDYGQCAISVNMEIDVVNNITPAFASIGPFCENSVAPPLPTVSLNNVTGTWSPSSINTQLVGNRTFTFTPDPGQCSPPVEIDIDILPLVIPTFTSFGTLCQNSIAPTLPSVSNNGVTGTWEPAVISTSAAGTFTYLFTPVGANCAVPVTMTILVTPEITPVFVQIGPLCQNTVPPALPSVSTNGITGTWNPSVIDTKVAGLFTYTFTPLAGQCAVSTSMVIEITDEITPVFAALGPFCQNSIAPALPLVSENGITGTWNPAVINTTVIGFANYTFTPDPGQCAVDTTISIEITNQIKPVFAAIGPYCQFSVAPALPSVSQNGISGSWLPDTIMTTAAGTISLKFIPDPDQCAAEITVPVVILPEQTPVFVQLGPLCQNSMAPVLPAISSNGITGSWSPAVIDTKITGTFDYIFTPDAGQCAIPDTMTIVVTPEAKPIFAQIGPLCQYSAAPALPLVSSNGIKGTWSPAVINTSAEGIFTFIFTPAAGECAIPDTISVEITPEITPEFEQLGPLCQNSVAPILPAVSTNGINGTWSPAVINTKVEGTYTFTFTPAPIYCAVPVTMNISITKEITPVFAKFDKICPFSVAPLLSSVSTNGIKGTWDPAVINTDKQGIFTFTFTPDSGLCAAKASIDIEISDVIPPVAISRNIRVFLDEDGKASITTAQINNRSYDNCELDTLYLSRYDFGCDDIGANPVTLTAVDAVGLIGTDEAIVTVIDTISPVVTCRGPFEIQLDQNAEYKLTVVEVLESVDDNCKKIDTMWVFPHELDCDNIGLTTITLMVTDANGNSSYCQTEVMIYGNRPPTVVDDSAFTKENVPVVIDIVENDFDEKTTIDVSSLSISIKPLYGKVSINPVNGDLTYTPNRNFSGVDVIKYRVYDDGIPCEPEYGEAYVYIVVEPVNDKPLAVDDYYSAGCFSVTGNVLDNDSDPDGTDNLQIVTNPLTPPIHGQLIIDTDGTISYFPNEGYIGIDSFQYVIWDNGIPEPLSDTAWVYIDVDCSEESQNPLDCELFVPEGFSPNQDGVHDFFRIMCIHNYPNAKLMIFNRNGDLLWQKQNYGNYDVWGDQYNAWWWGTSVTSKYDVGRQTINGEPKLKVGNYIYVLDLGNGAIKNGTVMISY